MFTLVVLALAFSSLVSATTITTFTGTVLSTDPTQLGRLSRNAIPQDWSGGEAYPGVINTGVSYHYSVYDIPAALFSFDSGDFAGYVQIDVDYPSGNTFVSAYANSYDPSNKQTNWLGDTGFSGNPFPGSPNFFQVLLNPGQDLILVINETTGAAGIGLGDQLGITVEGFTDSMYTDPNGNQGTSAVPEPASMVLLGTGVVVPWLRKKFKKA
jgi:hypothetical protein